MMKVERVVVIGGGLIGCSIAWRLAQRGMQVTVVEKDQPASKASWAAAGMLLPIMEEGSPLAPLTDASFQAYPAFVEELRELTGIDAELQLEGPGKGSVDNRRLGRAAYDAARQAGAIFRLRVEALTPALRPGRAATVPVDAAELALAWVVAGSAVLEMPAEDLGLGIRGDPTRLLLEEGALGHLAHLGTELGSLDRFEALFHLLGRAQHELIQRRSLLSDDFMNRFSNSLRSLAQSSPRA